MDALVAPNGMVRSIQVRGGHAVLVEAAENAIRKWKWATQESIEVKFDPH